MQHHQRVSLMSYSMEPVDECNTSLELGLGFPDELGIRLERKKKKLKPSTNFHRRGNKFFPFLALGLSELNHVRPKEDDDTVRDHVVDGHKTAKELNKLNSSDEDEDYRTTPRKKLRLSKDQISALEDTFKVHSTLNLRQKQDLATGLNLRPRQVEVWFQNRRARIKVKQTEMDRETLRKQCESLKEENRRLQKEVMELKYLKRQTVPFLMKLGAHQSCGCNSSSNTTDSPTTSFFSTITNSSKIQKITRLSCSKSNIQ